MCLDAYAHGMRVNHEIFQSPYPVQLTIEERPTPIDYQLRAAAELPKQMPMWRVQTEGYTEGTGQLVGVVSQPKGYADSPDVEWISSGVNTKAIDAVALGRHGNFFHWGFAASPTYMTEEAKTVLINALYYIAKFDGQAPLVRKQSGAITRDQLKVLLDEVRDAGYARKLRRFERMAADEEAQKEAIRERIEAGDEVSDDERRILEFSPPEPPDRLASLRRVIADADWPAGEVSPEAIAAALTTELPFFRYAGVMYQLEVDHDLMELGIPNNDPALLDWAVSGLTSSEHRDLARELLDRYTLASFETPAEWSDWLERNREHLFFTEAGGYKWLSSLRRSAQGAVPEKPASPVSAAASSPREPSRNEPFTAGLSCTPSTDGRIRVTLAVRVLRGWHAYDSVPKTEPYVALEPSLELADGTPLDVEWQRPASTRSSSNPRMTVFKGDLEFTAVLSAPALEGASEVTCRVRYQVCDEELCMPPTTETLSVQVPQSSPPEDSQTPESPKPH